MLAIRTISSFLDNVRANQVLSSNQTLLVDSDTNSLVDNNVPELQVEAYDLATKIITGQKIRKMKENHGTRFLQILLGYKTCFSYISMTKAYGCYCGVDRKNCQESADCLDDCCRLVI